MNKRYPRYPDDADYQTNAPSYYEDLARKQKLIQLLAEKIWDYDERLDERLEDLENVLQDYLSQWDERIENLDDEVSHIFVTWLEDGTLEKIINHDVLGNKADKSFVDQSNWNNFKQSAVNHSKIEPTVVWIDDDGDRGFYDTIKPILEKYNIVATSALVTGANHGFPIDVPKTIDGKDFVKTTDPMDWKQIKELRDSGLAEFVSHTHSNIDLREHTDEENYEDLKKSQKVLRELNLSPDHFVYPYGAVDNRTEPVVRQLFKSGFSTRSGIVSFPMNQFAIQRFSIGASTSLAQINQKTDEALAGGNLVVWVSHARNFDQPKVESAIMYALSKGFKFKTVTEAINEFGNLLDFDGTQIGANGQVRSRILGSYRYTGIDEPINNSTRSELRPVNSTTLGRLRTAEANDSNLTAESFAENFPLGHYWTYIDTIDRYNFQRALNLNENIESIRTINEETGEWDEWKDIGRVDYVRSIPEGRKPNEYGRNKITIENIGLKNIAGYNVQSSGVLVTIDQRLGTEGTLWTSQEFIPNLTDGRVPFRMYRVSTSDITWSAWVKNQQIKYITNRTWSSMEIQPKHTRKFVTAGERYTTDLAVETVIKNDLPIGLIVQSVIIENGQIETRVTNVRDTVITTDIVIDLIVKAY